MSEQFAGDAFIEIKPDLSGFLSSLNTQLAAMKPNPVVVPVVTAAGGQQVAQELKKTEEATKSAAAAATNLGVQNQKAATQSAQLTKFQKLQATAAAKLAFSEEAVVNASSQAAAAQISLTRATAATHAAQKAYDFALKSGTVEEFAAAAQSRRLAIAREQEAAATYNTARAEAARTAATRQGLRGGIATLLSQLGIRGATLAASGAFLAGAAAVTLFVKSIQSAARLETELATFKATTGALADEMIRVQEAAIRLGADITLPGVTAGDAAVAMTSLAKAGLEVEDAIAGARGVLQLATAAQIDNAAAAELTANALNAFGLAGDQAVRVADDLANAANASQGEIEDMGVALQQVAAVARQVGVGLEDTVSLLTLLAKNGLQGSDAGTSLRTAFLRLVNPTKEAAGFIELLNIQVRDLQGNVRPDVFAQFTEATRALSPAMRDAIIATVFGQDAIRAVAIAGREGADGLRLMQFEIDQQGTAAELAAARTSGLRGALGALGNQIDTSATKLGGVLIPAVEEMVSGFTDLVVTADVLISQLGKLAAIEDILVKVGIDFEFDGGAFEEGFKRSIVNSLPQLAPVLALSELLKPDADETAEEIAAVTAELKSLQEARIALEKAVPGAGDTLTPEVDRLKRELQALRGEKVEFGPPAPSVFKALEKVRAPLEDLRKLRKAAFEEDLDTSSYDRAIAAILAETQRLRSGIEKNISDIDFSQLSTGLQLALRGFQIDPTGERAAAFIKQARKIVGQIAELGPDVSAAAKIAFAGKIEKPFQESIRAAIAAGDLGSADAITKLANRIMADLGAALKTAAPVHLTPAISTSLQDMLAIAEATGASDAQILADLRRRAARLQDTVDRISAIPRAKRLPSQQARLEQDAGLLRGVNAEIERILGEQEAAAKEQADKIVKAKNEADQKVINALAAERRKPERLLERAGLNESLKDDLKFTVALQKVIRAQIKEANKRIKDAKTRNDVVEQLNDRLLQLEKDRKRLARDLADQLRQQREAREEALQRNLELRIDLAEARGNTAGEIRARLRFIESLQKQIEDIKKQKKLTIEQKNALLELQIEIARQQDALKDLRGTADARNNEFRKLTFSFLQTQQGFAANLLGNLIPGFATSGLVGGAAGVPAGTGSNIIGPGAGGPAAAGFGGGLGGALIQDKTLSDAAKRGPSGGQMSELIEVNRQIVRLLSRIAGDSKHPEAKRSKITTRTEMDMHK